MSFPATIFRGSLYVIGGYNTESATNLSAVEKLSLPDHKWSFVPNMNRARKNCATFEFQNRLFIFGGDDETIEMFDGNRWEILDLKWPTAM